MSRLSELKAVDPARHQGLVGHDEDGLRVGAGMILAMTEAFVTIAGGAPTTQDLADGRSLTELQDLVAGFLLDAHHPGVR